MKRGAYKNDQKRKSFNLYKQGFIVEDIAKEVNVSRKTVTLWLKEIREFDEDYIKKIKTIFYKIYYEYLLLRRFEVYFIRVK